MAKYKIEWSIEARLDLIDILDYYIKRNKSAAYSKKLNSRINRGIKLINRNPLIGLQSDLESVRAFITGDYQIIYEILDRMILIVMIWDCRRDPEDKIIDHRIKNSK
jgi:plasmid stabilization system protein ParE